MLMPIEGKKPVSKNGQATAEVSVMDVWVYQGKELNVFASAEAAQKWFDENDPEGVALMCEAEEVSNRCQASRLVVRPQFGRKIYVSPLPHRASSASLCSLWCRLF
jgi:hypothetical protein